MPLCWASSAPGDARALISSRSYSRHLKGAHIARVETSVDGKELEIFRRSVPFGTAEEHGLYFVAFSAQRSLYDRMLARMFGTAGDGVRDRLTDLSRPVSGACYFASPLR